MAEGGFYLKRGGVLFRLGNVDAVDPGPVIPTPTFRVRAAAVKFGTDSGSVTPPTGNLRLTGLPTNPDGSIAYGEYRPDTFTVGGFPVVGVRTETGAPTITQYQGNYNAVGNNTIIENLEIFGYINLGGNSNVTIRNCIIWGHANVAAQRGTLTAPIIPSSGTDLRGAIIEDCWIRGRGNFWEMAMRGGNYTMRRTEITGQQDGISLTSTAGNVAIEGCWLHNALYSEFSQADVDSGEHPAGGNNYTHCDGIQFHIGKNYVIRGNTIGGVREPWDHHLGHEADINSGDDWYNAAFMIKQEVSNAEVNFIDNVDIDRNWLWGGASTVNITSPGASSSGPKNYMIAQPAAGGRPARSGVRITDNRFLRSTWDAKLQTRRNAAGNIMDPSGQAYVLRDTGMGIFLRNVFDDNDAAVPIRQGGNFP